RRRQSAGLHRLDTAGGNRQRVDTDELHLPGPACGVSGEIRTFGHRVVVRVDDVDARLGLQNPLELALSLLSQPVADLFADDLDAGVGRNALAEAFGAFLGRGRP